MADFFEEQHEAQQAAFRFGRNLKCLRKSMGMRQIDMKQFCGIPAATISHYEIGERIPQLEMAVYICRAFGVTLDDMVNKTVDELGRWTQ